MAAGEAFTEIIAAAKQPTPDTYDMFTEPAETPATIPAPSTVATATLLLTHVPPEDVLVSVIVLPTHTEEGPAITAGDSLIVTTTVRPQPVAKAYVITDVPAVIPETVQVVPADNSETDVLLADHEPPPEAEESNVLLPVHTDKEPVTMAGRS
jgi:hypothetical protein